MTARHMTIGLLALALILAVGLLAGLSLAQEPDLQQATTGAAPEAALGTAFTYQGRLTDDRGPVNGKCDLRFSLWDASSKGSRVGDTLTLNNKKLQDGLISVQLDFGANVHDGSALWLKVAVRCPAGTGKYVGLSPLQKLTAAPAALALVMPFSAKGDAGMYNALFSVRDTGDGAAGKFSSKRGFGLWVPSAGFDGVFVEKAGNPDTTLSYGGSCGLEVAGAEHDGIWIGRAGDVGVRIMSVGEDGVYVATAGKPAIVAPSQEPVGFEVAGAQGYGVWVGHAGLDGVIVRQTGWHGLNVSDAGMDGLYVSGAFDDGLDVVGGNGFAGNFHGPINVNGGCIGCILAVFGVNAGNQPLEAGQIVAIEGIRPSTLDNAPALWQVIPAGEGQAAIGVVDGRAELDTVREGPDPQADKARQRLVPRQGAVQPGEYLSIVIYGPAQVKAGGSGESIQPGMRLTADPSGAARALKTVEVDGVSLTEGSPVLGTALDAPSEDGSVWVLVNPH